MVPLRSASKNVDHGAHIPGNRWQGPTDCEDRADDAQRRRREIHQVGVTLDKGLDFVVEIFGGTRMRHDEGILVGCRRLEDGAERVKPGDWYVQS
jgi:hypothetical protein